MKKIALSDVDGTIVRNSLVLGHAVRLHEEGVINVGDLAKDWVGNMKNETIISELAEAYLAEITGMTAQSIYAEEYIEEVVEDGHNFYDSVLDRLTGMRADGDDVFLISGSPTYLIQPFASHFDFAGIGSDYKITDDGAFTGKIDGMFHGDAKRRYVSSINLSNYSRVLAFGDTRSDSPLFERAHHSVLVQPNNETRMALQGVVHEIIED